MTIEVSKLRRSSYEDAFVGVVTGSVLKTDTKRVDGRRGIGMELPRWPTVMGLGTLFVRGRVTTVTGSSLTGVSYWMDAVGTPLPPVIE